MQYWKLYLGVFLVTVAFLGGAYLGYTNGPGKTTVLPMVITKKEIEIQEREKIVFKDRILNRKVVTEKKADGSVVETVEEKLVEKEKSQESEQVRKESNQVVEVKPNLKNYSLGIGLVRHWDRDILDRKLIPEYSVGYRAVGPVWLKAGLVPADKLFVLGLEFQF
jgi:hypothetical protein